MKWVVSNGRTSESYDSEQFYKLMNLTTDPQEIDQVMDINSMVTMIQQYFTKQDQPGYPLYSTINNFVEDILCQLLKSVHPEYLKFEKPYSKKELALMWMALNIFSEILEWLSGELQSAGDNLGIKSVSSLFLDSLSIIISLRMRELTETRIYGDVLEDRNKWGFLLKDVEKQVVAQLLNISLDVASFFSTMIKGNYGSVLSEAMTMIMAGSSAMNSVFIKQAYDGLMSYSSEKEGWGWIAWLIQELGYLSQDDFVSKTIGNISPISLSILGDVITVITMGMIFYNS